MEIGRQIKDDVKFGKYIKCLGRSLKSIMSLQATAHQAVGV